MNQEEQISLAYRDGGSDKVYHVQLQPAIAGWTVNFQYGRRGQTLQSGTKTTAAVPYDKAKKIYDRLVAEKTSKGYTTSEDGTPYQGNVDGKTLSGLVPQLLNAIEDPEVYIKDDAFLAQEKKDGVRLMVRVTNNAIVGSNRKGLVVPISREIEEGLKQFLIDGEDQLVLDGEAVGDVFHVFDLLERNNIDFRQRSTEDRYDFLTDVFASTDADPSIELVHAEWSTAGKRFLFEQLKAQRAEGLVFKRKSAAYVPGRPASGGNQVKFKFTQTCTCRVVRLNDKRSVKIFLRHGNGFADVGNVTIPSNYDIPVVGDLCEVRYLYAYPGGSLYQPQYLGIRTDLDDADEYTTLKFKQGTTDEEDA